jgi:hypothetical protein
MNASPPLACTLQPGAYVQRHDLITALNHNYLRTYQREDLTLVMTYDPAAVSQVRDLVHREQECCRFLRFDLEESSDEIRLSIRAPLEARGMAGMLFKLFLSGAASPVGDTTAGTRSAAVATACIAAACGIGCGLSLALPALALTALVGVLATLAGVYWWARSVAGRAVARRGP